MAFNIYELINDIRKRPALYISKPSITLLHCFLNGYIYALHDLDVEMVEKPPLDAFHDWAALKLAYHESTSGWSNMLLEAENGDEEKAFERFFIYLDEFKERQAKIIYWAVPDGDKAWRYQIIDGQESKLQSPTLVQIVKYTDDQGVFIRYLSENGQLVDLEEYCPNLERAFLNTEWFIERERWKAKELLDSEIGTGR